MVAFRLPSSSLGPRQRLDLQPPGVRPTSAAVGSASPTARAAALHSANPICSTTSDLTLLHSGPASGRPLCHQGYFQAPFLGEGNYLP